MVRRQGKTQLVVDDQVVYESALDNTPFEISQTWLTNGIDFNKRRVDLIGEVGEPMLAFVQRVLTTLNDISHDPIEIYLTTYGGDVNAGLGIYDILRESKAPTKIIASSIIASAGIPIIVGADIRTARKNTRFMIHGLSSPSGDNTDVKVNDLLINAVEAKRVNDMMFKIIAERTKIKFKTLQSAVGDLWFGVEEAKTYGILNEPKHIKRKKAKKS